jgi:2-amino-4-hydroxy-6-hydroxymethyldihydropteridine diphosphokinase / dihydropteroate synthase
LEWAEKQITLLEKNNISRERIIFDVGIGYGKTAEQSMELLHRISEFKKLNTRLLIGHSRKSFLQQFTPRPAWERDVETVSCSLYLAEQGVDYLRVHHVDDHARAFKIAGKLRNSSRSACF